MKHILIASLFSFYLVTTSATQLSDLEEPTNEFFNKYVSSGLVDYNRLAHNSTELDQLIQLYGMEEFSSGSSDDRKAFYINAYNLLVINGLVASYPAQSPQVIPGFFTAKKHVLLGEQISLNAIEKEKLFPSKDPRLHFVLVCGANGCPPLANFAYTSNSLDSLMEFQTRVALNNSDFIRYNESLGEIQLSQIFKWYSADFLTVSPTLVSYLNKYRTIEIQKSSTVKYYEYDWSINALAPYATNTTSDTLKRKSNLQLFTPSALFSWGEYEINLFNSVYHQNEIRGKDGSLIDLNQSQTFFNSLIQLTTGLPNTSRINVGIDVNLTSARYGADDETPLDFFNKTTSTNNKTLISSIGPRIKFVPFKKISRLSVQSTFLIPVASNLESPFFIAHDRYTSFTQVFFDQSVGEKFQLFLEADLLYRFNRNSLNKNDFFRTPLSGFFSYFPTSKATIYAFSQYSPRFENSVKNNREELDLSQWFLQLGIGAKYQLTPKLGIEVSYADFINSSNDGAGYSVNFGVRYIHR